MPVLQLCAALAVLAVLAVLATVAPSAAAGPAPALTAAALRVGVAVVDTTPPVFDPVNDAVAFPTCPAATFTGPRVFALQEPYFDENGSGYFNYPEPFCDANANTRYDGLYLGTAPDHLVRRVHDRVDARAIAFSDGSSTVVLVSVVAQGLFENYVRAVRVAAHAQRPGITDMLVSANHNESTPDTVGIYGAPSIDVAGARSGIDDYYMDFLIDRVATAAVHAYDAMQPATLHIGQYSLPSTMRIQLSNNFPTTDDRENPAAVDPKVGVLQARDSNGHAIFTMLSLAAHNQQIGHSGYKQLSYEISSDWPGYFHRKLEKRGGFGMPVFLVGDNGSIEDPYTVPEVDAKKHPECGDGCYAQTRATGEALADIVAAAVPRLDRIRDGRVRLRRSEFFVPLENNVFKVAAVAGLFGKRQTYLAGVPVGTVGPDLKTSVSVIDLGPDLQLLATPGESFPALTVGSHWGIDDAGCPERPNPPVPTWHARAPWRLQVGLADDLIGYLIPAWAFSSTFGIYTTTCYNDNNDRDPKGHQHKLETEGVGPTGSNLVAQQLTALLAADPDSRARVVRGRWILPSGAATRRPEGAIAAFVPDSGDGLVYGVGGLTGFEKHTVDIHAQFIDYDGQVQSHPDITTHGVLTSDGLRIYLDVYPALDVPPLGRASYDDGSHPDRGTGTDSLASTGATYGWLLLALAALTVALLLRRSAPEGSRRRRG
jgi:hypothetical protein